MKTVENASTFTTSLQDSLNLSLTVADGKVGGPEKKFIITMEALSLMSVSHLVGWVCLALLMSCTSFSVFNTYY